MKRAAIVVILVLAAAVLGFWRSSGGVRQGFSRVVGAAANETQQGDTREEIRKSFELQPGARIEISGINGHVDVQTSDTKTAEVYVLRIAGSRDSLNRREVTVEQTATGGLIVKARQVSHGFWEHLFGTKSNENVTIKAPRAIVLAIRGVNGTVISGDVDGAIEAKGINGRVELGAASDSADITGINGNVSVGLNKLGNTGARVSGINGNIELRLGAGLNADLTTKGMNGNVRSDTSDVTVDKDEYGSHYSAKIGSGGSPITISGINGNVRLTRTVVAATTTDKKTPETKSESKAGSKSSEK
jgi:DUF4097 and DUF4098 domain-containing protein YvlB